MIEVFQPPRITREETAYKMLFHVFAAFAASTAKAVSPA